MTKEPISCFLAVRFNRSSVGLTLLKQKHRRQPKHHAVAVADALLQPEPDFLNQSQHQNLLPKQNQSKRQKQNQINLLKLPKNLQQREPHVAVDRQADVRLREFASHPLRLKNQSQSLPLSLNRKLGHDS